MTANLVAISFDANDPRLLARFWAEALRWQIDDDPANGVSLVPTDSTPFRIRFVPVSAPKVGRNRIHFDLTTESLDDQADTVARLLELGGSHLDVGQGPEDEQVVLADPEGNELCIIEPTNNFLGDCERLGAVNCDGTQQVGYFWSEALGWPLVWDQDEETAIRAPGGTGPIISWGGPPVSPQNGRNRLRLDLMAGADSDHVSEVERLIALGAARADSVHGEDQAEDQGEGDRVILLDPDDNEFCVVTS